MFSTQFVSLRKNLKRSNETSEIIVTLNKKPNTEYRGNLITTLCDFPYKLIELTYETVFVREELYTQLFFLLSQYSSIDIFIVQDCEWYH